MKKTTILFFVFCTFLQLTTAQEFVKIEKKEFEKGGADAKMAWDAVKEGDDNFEKGRVYYPAALNAYVKAYKYNPNNPELNYKLGIVYLFSPEKDKSLELLKKVFDAKPTLAPDIKFFLARSYHLNLDFENAKKMYRSFMSDLTPKEYEKQRPGLEKFMQECDYGTELVKNKERVFLDNLGPNVNSGQPDYSPLISADQAVLIFTSRREETTGGLINPLDNMYFEDIYISRRAGKEWTKAENMGKMLNTKNNDAAVGLSPDGTKLFIFNGAEAGGDLYFSELKGNIWSEPEKLRKTINTEFHESSASISFDGKSLFFVSDRTGNSFGGHDIYVSKHDEKSRWDEPINLGSNINTPYDEEGVFVHPDNRTLYFSSKGHNSMGGYDIFKSTRDKTGKWGKPVNLGYPINTPDDEVFFSMAANGKHAYFSTSRAGGYGSRDVYRITFLGPEKPTLLSNEDNLIASVAEPIKETPVIEEQIILETIRLTLVKGIVTDAITNKPLEADIEIVDLQTNTMLSQLKANSETGSFVAPLPSGKNYALTVKMGDGYLFHSENFNIAETTDYAEVSKTIKLQPVNIGASIVLNNVFFASGKSDLNPESYSELDRFIPILQSNPAMVIEISGHTDNVGSEVSNKKLSEDRAKAVVAYLVSKGVGAAQLKAVGYGFAQPKADNKTEEGRKLNRRVEAKILKKA
ncbi:MAG TPA: hypothetical protein DCQ31_02500 [Bacteroidales bacterium]|nr:hypothetical protein [Bacteroidales bacterium]